MEHAYILLILACIFGFFMAWGIGANDVANAMGTSVGSKALTIRQAIVVAAIFETAGAILAGGQVTNTIRSGIIEPSLMAQSPEILVYGMLASLLAAGTWLLVASYFGWPVSTTHSIVGAIIGFALIEIGSYAIHWKVVADIALSWIVTPIIAGFIGYFIYFSVLKLIFNKPDPVANAKKYVPYYVFIVAFVIILVTINIGLRHLKIDLTFLHSLLLTTLLSFCVMLLSKIVVLRMKLEVTGKRSSARKDVEKVFGVLMIFTACAMAFAHGSNDIANAIGPLAAVINIVQSGGDVNAQAPIPIWILFFGAIGLITGLAMYGYRVIATIGTGITELTPSRGFSASLATASTVVLASGTGLPISTTQTLVGAVLGVGFARGIYALNLSVIRGIFTSWIITLPAGAILAMIFFWIIRAAFSF